MKCYGSILKKFKQQKISFITPLIYQTHLATDFQLKTEVFN